MKPLEVRKKGEPVEQNGGKDKDNYKEKDKDNYKEKDKDNCKEKDKDNCKEKDKDNCKEKDKHKSRRKPVEQKGGLGQTVPSSPLLLLSESVSSVALRPPASSYHANSL